MHWLEAAGWARPPVRTLDAKVTYVSRWYDLPPADERPDSWWWKHVILMPAQDTDSSRPAEHAFLSNFIPIEGDRMIASMGSWGLEMPRTTEEFTTAAERLRAPLFAEAMKQCEATSEVHLTRSTGNTWRRYDQLPVHPRGLVFVGDSICAFNPFYAQGISSAAGCAVLLRSVLADAEVLDADVVADFTRRQVEVLRVPWSLAMARDQGYECATGSEVLPGWRRRIVAALSNPVFNAITGAAREDQVVDEHFARVFNLDESLADMFRSPRVLLGLLRYQLRAALGRTTVPFGFDPLADPPATDYTPGATADAGHAGHGDGVSGTCGPEAEAVVRELGFSCRDVDPVVSLNDPTALAHWTQPLLELVIITGAVLALVHAVRRLRREGDPTNLSLWFASLAYLAVTEPPLYFPEWFGLDEIYGFIFAHNEFTVQLMYDRLPLYIVAFYPAISALGYEVVRGLGVFARRGPLVGAVGVAFVCQVFYEIFDHLGPQLRWWAWNVDNDQVNHPMLASVPMTSMVLFASVSMGVLTYLVVRLVGPRDAGTRRARGRRRSLVGRTDRGRRRSRRSGCWSPGSRRACWVATPPAPRPRPGSWGPSWPWCGARGSGSWLASGGPRTPSDRR